MSIWLSGDQQQASRQLQARLQWLVMGFIIVFSVIALRSLQLTLFPDDAHKPKDNNSAEVLTPRRADIVDRNGTLLATSLKVASLYADPKMIDDSAAAVAELKKIFPDLNGERLKAKLEKGGRFVWIKRHITPGEQNKVNSLGIPGLEFMDEYQRVYPYGGLAAHIVGAVNVDGRGLEGAEVELDEQLHDVKKSVKLAMDVRLQSIVAEEVQAQIDHFEAIGGAGMIIDINTGDVLAAVSLPTFDPNHPGSPQDRSRFNRLSSGVYEMGSSFKVFSTAAYLEKEDPDLNQTFKTTQPIRRGRFTITDYHPENHDMTIPEIFMHSSNIGAALMGEAVGTPDLKKFYEKLGFFAPLDTDLMTTARPLVPKPWGPLTTLTASYGHGIAVTPLHLAEGMLKVLTHKPAGLEFVLDDGSKASDHGDNVVGEKTSDLTRRMLRLTVRTGTGGKADVPGFLVGGKTATAEKTGVGGYNKSSLLSSFVGVYPADKPKTLVIVMIDEPKGQKDSYGFATAGWTAAPAVGRIISRITALRHELPRDPDRTYDPSDQLMTYIPEELRPTAAASDDTDKGLKLDDR